VRGVRKELREKGKRCTVTEERPEDWKSECGADEYQRKKSKKAGYKQYHRKRKGEKNTLYQNTKGMRE